VPSIVIPVGPMMSGKHEGVRMGACTDCRRLWASFRAGELSGDDLGRAHDQLMPTSGTCMVMGTASTMAMIAETLGFTLPGAATAPAVSSERMRLAEATGKRAVQMAKDGGPLPRALLTKTALRNASAVLQATSGSTNGVVHLAAIAGRAGIAYDLDELDRIGREVPVLANLRPAGEHFAPDFHAGGAVPALLRRLRDHLDLSAATVNGETLGDVVARWPAYVDDDVIRPLNNPVVEGAAIAVLRGSLAPDGAVIKLSAATPALCQHEGPALVFDSLDDLERRIDDPALDVTPEHVMVLRNAGPIGAPGMPEAGALPIPKKLGTKGLKDMVRISDARMSGTAFGTVVLHVAPEAAKGGPLALVRDGDRIRLDSRGRRLDLLVEDSILESRRSEWKAPAKPARGYARLYAEHVTQAGSGCDFDFLQEQTGEAAE
jgi:dihydroxy-acid dehydratase